MSLLLDALKSAGNQRAKNSESAKRRGEDEAHTASPTSDAQGSGGRASEPSPLERPRLGHSVVLVAFVSGVVAVALLLAYQRISDTPGAPTSSPSAVPDAAVSAAITQRLTDTEKRNARLDVQVEELKKERRELQQQITALTTQADARRSSHRTAMEAAARREAALHAQLAAAASLPQKTGSSTALATLLDGDDSQPVVLRLERDLPR